MGCYITPHLVSNPSWAFDPLICVLLVENRFLSETLHPLACYTPAHLGALNKLTPVILGLPVRVVNFRERPTPTS